MLSVWAFGFQGSLDLRLPFGSSGFGFSGVGLWSVLGLRHAASRWYGIFLGRSVHRTILHFRIGRLLGIERSRLHKP